MRFQFKVFHPSILCFIARNPTSSVAIFRRGHLVDSLRQVVSVLKIKCWTTQKSGDGKYELTTFCVPTEQVEECLSQLQKYGIGNNNHTSVSVVSSAIHLKGDKEGEEEDEEDETDIKLEQKKGRNSPNFSKNSTDF
jgi:hypothetical protein